MLSWLLVRGSYGLLFLALASAGFGVPIPEDVVLLSGGVLAHRGITQPWLTLLVCAAGVVLADFTLFTIVRRIGPAAFARPQVARVLSPARRARIEALFERFGGLVILVGRHLPGLRGPIFGIAAVHGMPRMRFMLWDILGLCFSAPLVFGLGFLFSDRLDLVRRHLARAQHVALVAVLSVIAGFFVLEAWRYRRVVPRAPK